MRGLGSARIEAYLRRVEYGGSRRPSLQVLRSLHLAHIRQVPFENLDIHLGREIVLSQESLYRKVVKDRRGGFCYELNGLFAALLSALGFRVRLLSARVVGADGAEDPPQGSVPVLWIIAGDQSPKAVGTIGAGRPVHRGDVTTIALHAALRELLDSGATLAITYEPEGEGLYDAPTTPIVSSGTVSHI